MQIARKGFLMKITTAAAAATLSLCLFAAPAMAVPSSAELQAQAQAILQQLTVMQEELDKASNNYYDAVAEQEAAEKRMNDAQRKINETNDKIWDNQQKLSARAKGMYRSGATSFLDMLLGAASFKDFSTTWELLETMNQNDAKMVQESKDLRAELEAQKVEYTEQKKVADAKAAEAKIIKDDAEAVVADMQDIYNGLSAEAAAALAYEQEMMYAAQAAAAGNVVAGASYGASGNGTWAGSYNAATGNSIVDRAMAYLGSGRYSWGACDPSSGSFDCSGFVSYAVGGGGRLGNTTTFMNNWGQVSDPQPGDVCVNDGHCGIYLGDGMMIHAADENSGICIGPVQGGMTFVRP